jgi:hypothetical protein
MNPILSVALFIVSLSAAAPWGYYFRYSFRSHATLNREEVVTPLERGLFADSLIVRDSATRIRPFDTSAAAVASRVRDTSKVRHFGTLLMIIEVTNDGPALLVTFNLKNILARPMITPDSVRTTRAGLDTAVFEAGRRIARQLAKR